jgi:hypothetical protein
MNLAAHATRELFRATFAERYLRENIDAKLRVTDEDLGKIVNPDAKNVTFEDDVPFAVDVIDVKRPQVALPVTPDAPPAIADIIAKLSSPPPPVPLRLNDPVFGETWEKLYANLFFENPHEWQKNLGVDTIAPYWRPLFAALVKESDALDLDADGAFGALWKLVTSEPTAQRFFTVRQRKAGGTVGSSSGLDLKLTVGEDEPDNPAALEYERKFRKKTLATPGTAIPVPALGHLLQAMVIFEDGYYAGVRREVERDIDNMVEKQEKMLAVLHSALTNDSKLALDELKHLAAETYLPDPRFHMQAKFTGRFKFSAQFLTAVRAAYTDLQNLARTSSRGQASLNQWGKRCIRPPAFDYAALLDVPMDVLTCNTDPAPAVPNGPPTRDHLDVGACPEGALTQLRSSMAFLVAQHIFKARLDAPDEYKSVVQHARSPVQLAEAQRGMTQFTFARVGARAWRVDFSA